MAKTFRIISHDGEQLGARVELHEALDHAKPYAARTGAYVDIMREDDGVRRVYPNGTVGWLRDMDQVLEFAQLVARMQTESEMDDGFTYDLCETLNNLIATAREITGLGPPLGDRAFCLLNGG